MTYFTPGSVTQREHKQKNVVVVPANQGKTATFVSNMFGFLTVIIHVTLNQKSISCGSTLNNNKRGKYRERNQFSMHDEAALDGNSDVCIKMRQIIENG